LPVPITTWSNTGSYWIASHTVPPPPMSQRLFGSQVLSAASSASLSCGPSAGSCGMVQKRHASLPSAMSYAVT
jgi:hypothetical protein